MPITGPDTIDQGIAVSLFGILAICVVLFLLQPFGYQGYKV